MRWRLSRRVPDARDGLIGLGSCVLLAITPMGAFGQGAGTRDLLQPLDLAAERGPFYVDFSADTTAPTGQDLEQLQHAEDALGGLFWSRRPVLVAVCNTSADRDGARRRAEWVRRYLVERGVPEHGVVHTAMLATAVSPTTCQQRDQGEASHRVVIRSWDGEQMADLRERLDPLPIEGEARFWHRPRGQADFQPMKEAATARSGDEFQVQLRASKPAFAYVFHRGSGGTWACLFPGALGTNPMEAGRAYWLPEAGRGFTLDDTPGQEASFVYLGDAPHPLLEQWLEEGVPWEAEAVGDADDPTSMARISVPEKYMNWYRRITFEHKASDE